MTYTPGEILLEKYRIERLLGQGTFGVVYLVQHQALHVKRAIKVLRHDADGVGSKLYQQTTSRFQQEAQLGALLSKNPYLLQIYDLILREDLLLLEMEYASGGSLASRIQSAVETGIPIPVQDALRIAQQVALALSALHERDIVHRDIKPANILFDEHGNARLADLGLVQIPHGDSGRSQLSTPLMHPGTPKYMSPEQEHTSGYLGPASDIYTLGVTLFEMLTGRGYRSQRPGTLASKLRADISSEVDQLLARMLSKDPEDRPWDGAETADLLEEAGKGSSRAAEQARLTIAQEELQARQTAEAEEQERVKKEQEDQAHRAAEQARLKREKEEQQARQAAEAKQQEELQARQATAREQERLGQVRQANALNIELAPGVVMEFVRVAAGAFTMGSDLYDDEKPVHQVTLADYLIGKTPVTNRQYALFARDVGKTWSVPAGKEDHPVVKVSWYDARSFCEWVSQKSGVQVRLPSEAEWEKAARGTDGRTYPWGKQAADAQRCNFNNNVKDTTPVGKYSPQGDSPYGCVDMVGNVWEWTSSMNKPYPYQATDGREEQNLDEQRVLRGGSWSSVDDYVRSAYRNWDSPSIPGGYNGFRCARSG